MTGEDGAGPSYYGQPVIKEPVWIWSVPAYLYVGGAAAGAALLGAVGQLADGDGYGELIRRCRRIAAAGTALGTVFLIHDLGRPARFLNMLRVFRPTSALNVGSWTLAAASTASGASAVLGRGALGDTAGLAAGAVSPVLASYTGVLLADTAIPVYQAARRHLPVLFAASALASAADLLSLPDAGEREQRLTRRVGIVAKAADLVVAEDLQRAAGEVDRVARPLREGVSGALWKAAKACTAASLLGALLPGWRSRRWQRRSTGVLGTLGAVLLRVAVFRMGFASARDPHATFARQRAGAGAAEVHGQAAVTGPAGRRATDP